MSFSMERWEGKVAIVTGASAGIGEAISRALVAHGLIVIGLARRKNRLDAIAASLRTSKGTFHPHVCDLSSEESILSAFAFAKTIGPIHILINNAAYVKTTTLIDGDTDIWRRTLDVNVLGLCIATREAVRDMRKNGVDGHIVHLNSTSGRRVPPVNELNVYPASKFAVTALTESLRVELREFGLDIKVTSVCPGLVKTEMFETSGIPYASYLKKIMEPNDVADAVVYILSTPQHVQVHDIMLRSVYQKL